MELKILNTVKFSYNENVLQMFLKTVVMTETMQYRLKQKPNKSCK